MNNKPKLRYPEFTGDWEQRKLGDICERVVRKNKNNESDLPLTISSQDGLIDQREFFNRVVAAKDMSNYYLLRKGEFAYNKSYSNGYDYGSVKRLNAYEQGCLSTLYICFGLTSENVESDYLECYFDTLKWYSDVSQICAEGARNHGLLNVDTKAFFDDVYINLPSSREEQHRISEVLNSLDNLITLHQRKLDNIKEYKTGMLQKMFPKEGEDIPEVRFPGFTDAWEQRKLGDMLDRYEDPVETPHDGYERIGIRSHAKGVFHSYVEPGKELDAAKMHRVAADKFILNITFAWEHAVAITEEEDAGTLVSHRFPQFSFHKELKSHFFKFLMLDRKFREYLELCSPGGAGRNRVLNINNMLKYKINVPSVEEQTKIGEYFDNLDNLITLHQRKLEELKEYKQGLLQQMFV